MKICYFGIYEPNLSRNAIYMKGLKKAGVEIVECRDTSRGFRKYVELYKKHRELNDLYDAMVVGYAGHIVVPFAKLISNKPVIADLLGSFKDAEVNSHRPGFFRRHKDGLIDWLAVKCADVVLLESKAQKAYFVKKYGDLKKFHVLYTGLDEEVFSRPETPTNGDVAKVKNMVLFRGRLTPESGILHILSAAEIALKERPDIPFRVIGFDYRLGQKVKDTIRDKKLVNVELIYDFLPEDILRQKMREAVVSLGQFESNPRLDRTIPHKAFESMAMRLPFVTAYSGAVAELLKDGESCIFVKRADPKDILRGIYALLEDPVLAEKLAEQAHLVYEERCSTSVLVARLIDIIKTTS